MDRRWDQILITCTALLLLSGTLLLLFLPKHDFSESENRRLTTWQSPSLGDLADGSFSELFSNLCADQFPARSALIALKAKVERAWGKGENKGIVFGDHGYLIPKGEYPSLELARQNAAALSSFAARSGAVLCTVPRHIDVLPELLPEEYDTQRAQTLPRLLEEQGIFSLSSVFWGNTDTLYRTDHHQTTMGAYLAYVTLGEALGYTPYQESDFVKNVVSQSFYGTSHATVGGIGGSADTITLWRYEGDENFSVTDLDTGKTQGGFYRLSALQQRNHYEIFFGGNFGRLSITEPGVEKPSLLLIKDSQANCLLPFLARHFDLTVLDLRYTPGIPEELSRTDTYHKVLVFLGADTLATDGAARKLITAQNMGTS